GFVVGNDFLPKQTVRRTNDDLSAKHAGRELPSLSGLDPRTIQIGKASILEAVTVCPTIYRFLVPRFFRRMDSQSVPHREDRPETHHKTNQTHRNHDNHAATASEFLA